MENSGAPLDTTGYGDYFYYDGHRVLEHRKTSASDTAVEPHRRYVYGLDYIDEVVAYYDTGAADPDPHFVLQDANYDVVGVTDHLGYLEQQYSYAPYGAYQHIEDGSGNAEGNGPADLTELLIPLGRNGLILDRETGLYYNRARYYDPLLSRFLQADPNGTGLVLTSGASHNAVTFAVQPAARVAAQYGDGMSLYHYVQSNPARHTDVLGMKCGPWTSLRVSNGFQTVTVRGTYLREAKSTEKWLIRGLLQRTLKEARATVRDVDFTILNTVKVGVKVIGFRADNGEADDADMTLGMRSVFYLPTAEVLLRGYSSYDHSRIDWSGRACRKKEICVRTCVRDCDDGAGEYREEKTIEGTGKSQHIYGKAVFDNMRAVLSCETIGYGETLCDVHGSPLGTNNPGPLQCGEGDVGKCE